ncbi:carbamoyltransferase [Nocardia salmonicida]|uniref:carbamoyltransferase n=1 Tax=Nocardia salmonicida TaxID=53431 RepID=UPI0037AF6B6D
MAVLGLCGLFTTDTEDYDPTTFAQYSHDATACLVDGGKTLAAIEEERLNRDKHTFRFPGEAVRACLDLSGIRASEITSVAYYFEEKYVDLSLAEIASHDPNMPWEPSRLQLSRRLAEITGHEFEESQLVFVSHHRTHAASAYYDSGLSNSLVVVSDGNAERDGISIFHGNGGELDQLHNYDRWHSLGHFYTGVTELVGYQKFDEYKVMGLASFGDPSIYRKILADMVSLDADGRYSLPYEQVILSLIDQGFAPRRAGSAITQAHKDLAASAQELVERISLHIVRYWLEKTGSRNLCLAGGVAQNTSLNGKLLAMKGLDHIYIPPAAHDGGAALGAAMIAEQEIRPARAGVRYSDTAYLGSPVGSDGHIKNVLDAWSGFVSYEEVDQPETVAAECLAADDVIAWVQGRAEFGPRALGNRSILADPRPASNRDRVNRLIKKREDYRPFAPVVTAGDEERYFDLADVSADHSYMGFVVPVRSEYQDILGATTHVDGTARVQVLRRQDNQKFWSLIKEFEKRTGTPVLLNTSYNNSAEPIVQSVEDAVATFVTTGLDKLFIGSYVVELRPNFMEAVQHARLSPLPFCAISRRTTSVKSEIVMYRTSSPNKVVQVSTHIESLIENRQSIAELVTDAGEAETIAGEVWSLWERRLIKIIPEALGQ